MKVEDIHKICVVGSGSMGHQIAMLCALGGFETRVQDLSEEALQKARRKLEGFLGEWVKKGKIPEEERKVAFSRLSFVTDLREAVKDADFVIEAVVEKLEVKR